MPKNAFLGTFIAALVGGTMLLYMEYGFFENDTPIIIVQSPVPVSAQSDKPIVILPSSVSEPDKGAQEMRLDTVKPPPSPPPLDFKINYLYLPSGASIFQPLTKDSVLHSGDYYKVIFTPLEDSYVYIFQMDSAKKIYQLFPMASFKGVILNNANPLQGRETYYIPAKDKSFVLDEQLGMETIYFLASRQRDIALEAQYENIQVAQRHENAVQLKLAEATFLKTMHEKGLINVENDKETLNWTEQGRHFSVLRQRLDGLCQECIQVLAFKHE